MNNTSTQLSGLNATERPLRVGMIGAGWVSRYHLLAWQRMAPAADVIALCDPNPNALKERSREFSIGATYHSAEALLAEASTDIIDICTPREFHAPLVRLMAQRGLPTICQKPLGVDLAEASDLVAEVGDRIPLMVHENWRFRVCYRRIAEWLQEQLVGDLQEVHLEYRSSGMIPDRSGLRPALVRQPFLKTLDRMLIAEILIHHLDTLRFLVGEMEVQWARLARSNNEIIGEDIGTILLARHDGGIPVMVAGNLATHGQPPAPKDHLRIIGTAGTIELDGERLTLSGRRETSETFDLDAIYQGAYDTTIGHFVDKLRSDQPFETAAADNLKTLALVEAIYSTNAAWQSARQ